MELCAAYVAAVGAGNTTTLTIVKNGSAGTSTIVIGPGVSGKVTGTGTDTIAVRDAVDMRIASVGGAAPVIASWSCGLR